MENNKCIGSCNGRFYGTIENKSLCSVCYILKQKNITFKQYYEERELPYNLVIDKLKSSDKKINAIQKILKNKDISDVYVAITKFIIISNIYLSAEQSAQLINGKTNDASLCHAVSFCVIDTWNLNPIDHGVGSCYYGNNNRKPHDPNKIELPKLKNLIYNDISLLFN